MTVNVFDLIPIDPFALYLPINADSYEEPPAMTEAEYLGLE